MGESNPRLEEGVVPGCDTDVLNVRHPDALLRGCGSGHRAWSLPKKDGLELQHSSYGEQDCGI